MFCAVHQYAVACIRIILFMILFRPLLVSVVFCVSVETYSGVARLGGRISAHCTEHTPPTATHTHTHAVYVFKSAPLARKERIVVWKPHTALR